MRYDLQTTPDPNEWLALDESQRLERVSAYHRRTRVPLQNVQLHAAAHVIVENQLAEGMADVRDRLERLLTEGLDRHEAIHAIGSVLVGQVWELMRQGAKTPEFPKPYVQALRALTTSSWREQYGTLRQSIPAGTKLLNAFGPEPLQRSVTYTQQYYSSEIPPAFAEPINAHSSSTISILEWI